MENQHRHIAGYRELSHDEIAVMNGIKGLGQQLEVLVETLRRKEFDQRWVSIGQTQLQQGIMALVRAVGKPTTF
jgi:hypothetical protein